MGRAQEPRHLACARRHVSCGAAGAPLSPGLPTTPPTAGVGSAGYSWRGGEAGGCGFPRLGFPPGAPFSEAPPFQRGSSAGGQTHPRSVAGAPSLGATARRPFPFRAPPPFGWGRGGGRGGRGGPPGPRRRAGGGRGAAGGTRPARLPRSAAAAVHARPSANKSRRLRAWPASLIFAPSCGHWVYAPFAAGRLARAFAGLGGCRRRVPRAALVRCARPPPRAPSAPCPPPPPRPRRPARVSSPPRRRATRDRKRPRRNRAGGAGLRGVGRGRPPGAPLGPGSRRAAPAAPGCACHVGMRMRCAIGRGVTPRLCSRFAFKPGRKAGA
jgi:hypothetical protein